MNNIYKCLCIIFIFTVSCKNKGISNKNNLFGTYVIPSDYLELNSDSTFVFGPKNIGIRGTIYRGTYKVQGIKIFLKIEDSLFKNDLRIGTIEEGYIDFEYRIVYAFDYRLKKAPVKKKFNIKKSY